MANTMARHEEAPNMVEENRYQIVSSLSVPVGTPAMSEIDRELTPIIAELATLEPGDDQHPTASQLFDWLVDPQRTADEFSYAIGPLEHHAYGIMENNFKQYLFYEHMGCSVYVGKVAAEALAARSPILEGPWEKAAWFVIRLNHGYHPDDFGFASDRFSIWIINVLANAHICPNAYLRFELIYLFHMMVDTAKTIRSQALEAVVSACSTLNVDYLSWSDKYGYTGFFNINRITLTDIFEKFTITGDCPFDNKLADILKKDVSSRLWQLAYNHSIHPIRYTEPVELQSLTALLNITSQFVQEDLNDFKEYGIDQGQHRDINDLGVEEYSRTLSALMSNFKITLQTPQLMEATSSCIMDVVEFVMLVNRARVAERGPLYFQSVINISDALEVLTCGDSSVTVATSPIGRDIIRKYSERLQGLRVSLPDASLNIFPIIRQLLYYDVQFDIENK
ncbi:unnamed protein product, partial [Meganyctiphanes norvegica]